MPEIIENTLIREVTEKKNLRREKITFHFFSVTAEILTSTFSWQQ